MMSRRNRVEEVSLNEMLAGDMPQEAFLGQQTMPNNEVQQYTAVDPNNGQLARVTTDGRFLRYLTPDEIADEARKLVGQDGQNQSVSATRVTMPTATTPDSEGFHRIDVIRSIGVRTSDPRLDVMAAQVLAAELRGGWTSFEQQSNNSRGVGSDSSTEGQAEYHTSQHVAATNEYNHDAMRPQGLRNKQAERRDKTTKRLKMTAKVMGGCAVAYMAGSATFGVLSWVPFYGPQHTLWSEKGQIVDDLEAVLNFVTQHQVAPEK